MISGETFSHYRVIELLGAGGMGEVYKAEDTRLRRTVALKFLPLAMVQDRDAKERLVLEAQAASALDHPNICTIHEIDETPDGRLFLAMAYYEGETLRQRIARGPMPLDEALDIIAQIARGLAAAHDAGIIHRDIKPANIILTPRGGVKLLDFGVAKLLGQTALTRTGTTVGTIAYMPPEQIMGRGADARSDVWALGVVLYEMLTGRLPFSGEHEVAILNAIATATPAPLHDARADAAALEPIVTRALQKEPGARYASAGALLQDVEPLRAPQLTTARHATSTVAPPARAGRWAIASGIAVLVLIATLAGWLLYRNSHERWARRQGLPQVAELIRREQYAAAFRLIGEIQPYLADDPEFVRVRDGLLFPVSIRTTPSGADVYVKGYAEVDRDWEYLGRSPLDIKGPIAYFRWRVVKSGYTTFEGAAGMGTASLSFHLDPEGALPENMVRVPGGTVALDESGTFRMPDFFLDKFEVTNRAYKKFIEAGGYRRRELWQNEFVRDGGAVSWDEAMAEFRDATGRAGPSTWELGTYPEGHDDSPVHGVNWYEADAYARFIGKALPTVYHWRRAAAQGIYSDVLELSNFSGKGPARVGSYQGIGEYGTYDMTSVTCFMTADTSFRSRASRRTRWTGWTSTSARRADRQAPSAFLNSSLTRLGLAFPAAAFIT